MLIGVSFKHTDKGVDKLLAAQGIEYADVYYSPVASWWTLILLALHGIGGFLIEGFRHWVIWLFALPWLLISYFIYTYLSTSIALCEDKLVLVNPNFPFYRLQEYSRDEIVEITIGSENLLLPKLFFVFGSNYVAIKTKEGTHRYYCTGLELDAYDENWTENTIDDLHGVLKRQNYPVTFTIKD